jgi:hypothetical protein
LIATLVDDDLTFAIPFGDLAGPRIKRRPIQPRDRGIIETTFNNLTDER